MAKKLPASIRHNNPGAMWMGPSARRFGATTAEKLKDGLNQGNEIASFPTKVQGAAALFDLLNRSYTGMTLRAAISKWSGGNHVASYLAVIEEETGFDGDLELSREFMAQPTAIALAMAMAKHEAGREYPLTTTEWHEAHAMVFTIPAADVANDPPAHLAILQEWADEGVRETPGPGNNATIDEMYLICGYPKGSKREEVDHWCAIAAYASVAMTGGQITEKPKNLMARSFLRWGVPVKDDDIRPGDFRVMKRGSDPQSGHVDCVEEVDHATGMLTVIGGNVSNKVTRRPLPIKGALGYRRRWDGAKPVVVAVKESPSILGLIKAGVAGIIAGFWALVDGLPTIASEVSSGVGAAQEIAEHAGLPLQSKILLTLSAFYIVKTAWRMIGNRQADA